MDVIDKSYCVRFVKYEVLDLCLLQISKRISCSGIQISNSSEIGKKYVPKNKSILNILSFKFLEFSTKNR